VRSKERDNQKARKPEGRKAGFPAFFWLSPRSPRLCGEDLTFLPGLEVTDMRRRKTMEDLQDISNFKEFLERMKTSKRTIDVYFHQTDAGAVSGIVAKVADDFVEVRRGSQQIVCPYTAIRIVRVGKAEE
jgi:hypothetical protein